MPQDIRSLSYRELMSTLQRLCKEQFSGVMIICSDSGDTAKLVLEQGVIFDVTFSNVSGKAALASIKKIVEAKVSFFKRLQGCAIRHIDLSTDEILQTLAGMVQTPETPTTVAQESSPAIQFQAATEEQLLIIEAYLAAIVWAVARIIYQEYKEDVQRAEDLTALSSVIEKMAQQVLIAEHQKLFKQNIREFIYRCGLKEAQAILVTVKSAGRQCRLHPTTLALCISKHASQGELSVALLSKLAPQLEYADNLAGVVKLIDVLKFLEKTTKTGLLAIEDKGKKAGFYFDQGVLINAFDADRHGVAVALDLLQWQPDNMHFVSMARANVASEIHQTVDILLSKVHVGLLSKEEGLKYTKADKKNLSSDDIQAALTKEIARLQNKSSDRKEEAKRAEAGYITVLAKAIHLAESYDNIGAEQLLSQVLLAHDEQYYGWFWLARVLTNMTVIEFALKKAAYLNSKSSELADEVKKFTLARKLIKSDFVLRCPFCWMPVKEKDHECPHCLAEFFIDSSFFNKVGKAKNDVLDKAIARYDQALQGNSGSADNVYLHFYLAMAYLNRKYYQEGWAQFNEIVKLAPENLALLQQASLLTKYMQSAGLIASTVQQSTSPCTTAIKAKILVVEDSVVTRKVIARTLTANCYEVFEAKNAEEALNNIVERNPDLVLLDIILPGDKDGYDILAEIRQTPAVAKVPVVMLTSRDSLFDKLKGKVSDADEYLTKPFQPDELLLVVKKYLK